MGSAAPILVDGQNQELMIGHQSSTVCKLLRVAQIMTNNGSLVSEGSGEVTLNVDPANPARNV